MKLYFSASLFAVAMIASASLARAEANCANDDHYPLVQKKDLQKWVKEQKVFVIDVNSDESFKAHHVPNAIHYSEHKNDLASLLPKDKNAMIVTYCGGPKCEAWKTAAEAACNLKYTQIYHFKDGISGWIKN